MEKKKATKVGCQACKKNENIKNLQNFVFIAGGLFLILAIVGTISLIKSLLEFF